jgi:uncharacterized protein (TIGR02231 family)
MKKLKISFLLLIVLLAPSVSFGQHEIICKSEIKKVSVFINQAQVERQAKVTIDAGVHILIFDKISPVLVDGSIELKAPDGIEILSVSMQNEYLEKGEKPASIIVLEDSLEAVKERLFEIQSDKESIALQRDLLLANKSIGGSNQGVKAEELEDVLGIYQKKFQEFKLELVLLNKRQKEYTSIRDLLQQQLDEYTSGTLALNRRVLVQVKATKSYPEAQLDLIYLVGNVSWVPTYDIRVNDQLKEVQFVLKATVNQLTGEDWRGVHLFLTTSDPFSGGTKPELKPLYIQYYIEKEGAFNAYRGNEYKKLEAAPSSMNNSMEFAPDKVITKQNSTNLEFEVQGLSSIPADGKFHLVELSRFTQAASYSRQAVPKINPDVFVTAKVQTNDLINQLNGEANIYLNGTFTGKTFLSQQSGDSLLITLGKDRRIIAKREKVKEMCSKSFFGSNRKENNTIELSLTNSGTESVLVDLEDQIPLSSKEEIVVKLIDGGAGKYVAETGMLQWKVTIPAKQTIKLRFSFEVSYPADKTIEGY